MANKVDSDTIANNPMTGVGILSGFGTPEHPPEYNLKQPDKANKQDKGSKQKANLDSIMELEEIESGKPDY